MQADEPFSPASAPKFNPCRFGIITAVNGAIIAFDCQPFFNLPTAPGNIVSTLFPFRIERAATPIAVTIKPFEIRILRNAKEIRCILHPVFDVSRNIFSFDRSCEPTVNGWQADGKFDSGVNHGPDRGHIDFHGTAPNQLSRERNSSVLSSADNLVVN